MSYIKKIYAASILSLAVLLNVGLSEAFEDGFGSAKKIDGEHVSVYCAPELDIAGLDRRLNIRPSDKILAGKAAKTALLPEKELSDTLDTLFVQVSENGAHHWKVLIRPPHQGAAHYSVLCQRR